MTDLTALDETEPPPNPGDVLLMRVIVLVACIGILSVVAIAALTALDAMVDEAVNVPGVLDNLATGALVGLTGLLAARRT